MGEYRFNWRDTDHGNDRSFEGWLIPTLVAAKDADGKFDELAAATKDWTDVVITMQINGIEVGAEGFLKSVERNLTYLTEREARRLVLDDERLHDIYNAAADFQREIRRAARERLAQLGIETSEEDDW